MQKRLFLILILQCSILLIAMTYIGSPLVSERCHSSVINDNILYVTNDWGLMIYDISIGSEPVLVNKIQLNKGRGAVYAKITCDKLVVSGLSTSIYDISNPMQPEEICNMDLSNIRNCELTENYFLVNNREWLSEGRYNLYSFSVYDLSSLPDLIETTHIDNAVSLEMDGDNLYLIDYTEAQGTIEEADTTVTLKKYNFGENGILSLIDSLELSSSFRPNIEDVPYLEIHNEALYVKTSGNLYSINVDSTNLNILNTSNFEINTDVFHNGKYFTIFNNYLFGDEGEYWDISDSNNITHLGLWTEEFSNPDNLRNIGKICSNDNYLYVPNWDEGYFIFDISNPINIEIAHHHQNFNNYKGVAIKDNYLYVTSWYALDVIDISDPNNPEQINSTPSLSYLSEIIIEGDYAYVGADSGLIIYDISVPYAPNLINYTQMHAINHDIEKHRSYIYGIGMDYSGNWLTMLDVSNVTNPVIELQLHDNENLNNIRDLTINQDIMYIADANWNTNWSSYSGGLRIYDMSNPIEPTYLSTCNPDTTNKYVSITIKDDMAYLSGARHNNAGPYGPQTWVIDISNPSSPETIQVYDDPIGIQKAVVAGDYRYTGGSGGGVIVNMSGETVYDISDPQNPILVDYIEDHSGCCRDIIVKDGYIYSAKEQCVNIYYTEYYNVSSNNDTVPDVNIPELSQNYPNPFNPTTTIRFSIPANGDTELTIYNIKGQKVKTLLNKLLTSGTHSIIWNGQDSNGKSCSSGLYLYKLSTEQTSITKKMILIK